MSAVLVIAGSDSSGGAGLARDLRTLAELSVPAVCALTAVTAQTHAAVRTIHRVPAAVLAAQLEAAFASATVAAVKIGMLASADAVDTVAACLAARPALPVVLDPVLAASAGGELLDAAGRARLLAALLPRVALLTPNLPEAAALLGTAVAHEEAEVLAQGRALLARGARAVLMKGGHAAGADSIDLLLARDAEPLRLAAPRSPLALRGSGCALASAIAAQLARGADLAHACARAMEYVLALRARAAA